MDLTTNGAGLIAAAAFTLPALGFAFGPLFSRVPFEWQTIGVPSDFPKRHLLHERSRSPPGSARSAARSRTCEPATPSIDTEKADQYNQFVALSSRCMHLGCPVRFTPAAERFICPCHGGVYDFRGLVNGGPPVRPLDRFYTRLPRRLRADRSPLLGQQRAPPLLRRVIPAEPLDGIGQYLYPKRFSTSVLPSN